MRHRPTCVGSFAAERVELRTASAACDRDRRERAKRDALPYLSELSDKASKLGCIADEPFGFHPVASFARCDVMGLVRLLDGKNRSAVGWDRQLGGCGISDASSRTKVGCHGRSFQHGVVALHGFGPRDVGDGLSGRRLFTQSARLAPSAPPPPSRAAVRGHG